MNTVCSFCGNKNFKQTHVQYIYKHDDHFLLFNNVPAEVCEFCGEEYYDVQVIKNIEHDAEAIISEKRKVSKSIDVPILEYAEIGK